MDNYSKVLTFFMENGITLTPDQLTALQEEFLGEATNDQKKYVKKMLSGRVTDDDNLDDEGHAYNKGFLGKPTDEYTWDHLDVDRSKDVDNMEKAKAAIKNVEDKAYETGKLGKDRLGRHVVAKDSYSKIEDKQDKIAGKAADKLFKEKEAWKDNEKYNKITKG